MLLASTTNGPTLWARDYNLPDPNIVYGDAPVARVGVWMQLLNDDGSIDGAAQFKGFYNLNELHKIQFTPDGDRKVKLYAIPQSANGTVVSSALEDATSIEVQFHREVANGTPPVISLSGTPSATAAQIAVANISTYATQRRIKCSTFADMSSAEELIVNASAGNLPALFELLRGTHPQTLYITVAHSSGGGFGPESNVLEVTFESSFAGAGLAAPFNVTSTTLPIDIGVILKDTPPIYSVNALTLRNASGDEVPAAFTLRARYHGELADTTKPIKVVGVYFTPVGGGAYTIDDSGENPAPVSPFAITDTESAYTLVTGGLKVTLPKNGSNLLTKYELDGAEQLASATKPTAIMSVAAKSRLVSNVTGVSGNIAAAQGQNFVTVRNPLAFSVGQTVKPQWIAKYTGNGNDYDGDYLRLDADVQYTIGTDEFTPDQKLIFARGTGNEFILTAYNKVLPTGVLYRNAGDGFPIGTMPLNVTVEDKDAFDAGTYVIQEIQGNKLIFTSNLSKRLLIGTELVPVSAASPLTAQFKVKGFSVVEQSAQHVIVKQTGWFEVGTTRIFPYLSGALYWYFYAGHKFARCRFFMRNYTTNIALEKQVFDADFDTFTLSVPMSNLVTSSIDSVTTHDAASIRDLAGTGNSTAVSGFFGYTAVDLAQNFPASLVASGSTIDHTILPANGNGYQYHFFAHWGKVWDLFLGQGASAASVKAHDTFATLDRAYTNELAIWPSLPPVKHTWTSGEAAGNAAQVEALNIVERMYATGWDYTQNDSLVAISPAQQLDLARWKDSNYLHPASNDDNGIHFGWQMWGNTNEPQGGDNVTNNRYGVGDCMGKNWLRSGDIRAYRLMSIHAVHAATSGTCWSAISSNGNTEASQEGGAWYEKAEGPNPLLVRDISKPTHDWPQLGAYYLLTGDPIAYEALLIHRKRALMFNFQGVGGGYFTYNDIRALRAAKKCLESYLVFGISSDLARCRQYLMNLRDSIQSQGGKGWYSHRDYQSLASSGLQLFNEFGYVADTTTDYCLIMRSLGTPDTVIEQMLYDQAKFAVFGDSTRVSPGNNAPMRYDIVASGNITPAGACYNWYPTGNTTSSTFILIDATLNLHGLTLAAFWYKNAALKKMAQQVFQGLAFYRDMNLSSPVPVASRQPISFRNRNYFGTSLKVYFQMIQATMLYFWYVAKNASLNPPVLGSISPTSGAANSTVTLTLSGSGFVSGCEVSVGGITGLIPTAVSNTSITVALPANSLPAGNYPVMVTNPNNGQSDLSNLTLT